MLKRFSVLLGNESGPSQGSLLHHGTAFPTATAVVMEARFGALAFTLLGMLYSIENNNASLSIIL